MPIENAAMPERSVIQWDKDDLEALGLLKVDVLALGMLTAIRRTLDMISARGTPLTMQNILDRGDDPAVYVLTRLLAHGMRVIVESACSIRSGDGTAIHC